MDAAQVISEFKTALEKLNSLTGVVLVTATPQDIKVVVENEEALERIPGDTEYLLCETNMYSSEARRVYGGVTFFCLVKAERERPQVEPPQFRAELAAQNFIEAATELIDESKASSLYASAFTMLDDRFSAHMNEENFLALAGDRQVEIKDRGCSEYPLEKSLVIGGVKFYCLSKDLEAWARMKGYVRASSPNDLKTTA